MVTTDDEVTAAGVWQPSEAAGSARVDAPARCLTELTAVLDRAAGLGWGGLSEAQLRAGLEQAWRAKARVDEVFARLVVEAEQRGLPVDDGASSTRAWLGWKWRMSRGSAAAVVASTAAFSPRTAATRRAWAAGVICAEQAAVIGSTIDGLSADVDADRCGRAEAILVDRAAELTYRELRVLANRVVEVVDPEGADARIAAALEAEESRAVQATSLRRFRRGDGMTTLTGRSPTCTPTCPTGCSASWPRHAAAAPPTWAPCPATTPGTPGRVSVRARGRCRCGRGPRRRRGRAVERRAALRPGVVRADRAPPDRRSARSGCGERDGGGEPRPGCVDVGAGRGRARHRHPHLGRAGPPAGCNSQIVPMVLSGTSRILDQGRSRRLFDRHQRVALTVRDRGCIWPGCDRPPGWTEAHHIAAWSRGGATDLVNGCLLCSFDHHLLHKGEWAVRVAADGIPEVLPPHRIDPTRTPIRHQRFWASATHTPGGPQP
jgi:hypothetical protein